MIKLEHWLLLLLSDGDNEVDNDYSLLVVAVDDFSNTNADLRPLTIIGAMKSPLAVASFESFAEAQSSSLSSSSLFLS